MINSNHVASRYLEKTSGKDNLKWGISKLESVLKALEDVVLVWTAKDEASGYEGFESLADRHGPVNQAVHEIQEITSRNISKIIKSLKNTRVIAATGIRLDPKVKRNVARTFTAEGLDGKGSFVEPQEGFTKALNILQHFGIVANDIVSGNVFNRDKNHFNLEIGTPSPESFMPPTPIKNSMLVFTYYKRSEDNYEVLAYLS